MKILLLILAITLVSSTHAQEKASIAQESPCPNPGKLRNLCVLVGSHTPDSNPQGRFKWLFQRRLMEAACADPLKDSEEEIGRKIAKVWNENIETLTCDNTRFDVLDGNIIKYAVARDFKEFILEVATWKVNLNKVDKSDDKTVLDYIQEKIETNKGNSLEPSLKHYYQTLRKAGAKHKWELEASE